VPRLCEVYPGVCLTTEGKTRKNLSQGSRRMTVGTMKIEYTEQSTKNIQNRAYRIYRTEHTEYTKQSIQNIQHRAYRIYRTGNAEYTEHLDAKK